MGRREDLAGNSLVPPPLLLPIAPEKVHMGASLKQSLRGP